MARELMSTTLTLSRYRDILEIWGGAWVGLEFAIALSVDCQECQGLLPHARAGRAVTDLRSIDALLGQPPNSAVVAPPRSFALIPAQTLAELLGMCYVAQGALLGGQVIARRLHQTLQLAPGIATSFFDTAEPNGMTWTSWTRALSARVSSEPGQAEALHGARRTFAYLQMAFTSYHSTASVEIGVV